MNLSGFVKKPVVWGIILFGIVGCLIQIFWPAEHPFWFQATTAFYLGGVALCFIISLLTARVYASYDIDRKVWYLIAVGIGLFLLAESLWSYYQYRGENPFPSLADVFYIAGYFPIIAGFVVKYRYTQTKMDAKKLAAMGLILGVHDAIIGAVIVAPYFNSDYSLAELGLSIAYPVLDVILLILLTLVLLAFSWGAYAYGWLCVASGLIVMMLADIGFAALDIASSYSSLLDAGWLASYTLIALGALYQNYFHRELIGVK